MGITFGGVYGQIGGYGAYLGYNSSGDFVFGGGPKHM